MIFGHASPPIEETLPHRLPSLTKNIVLAKTHLLNITTLLHVLGCAIVLFKCSLRKDLRQLSLFSSLLVQMMKKRTIYLILVKRLLSAASLWSLIFIIDEDLRIDFTHLIRRVTTLGLQSGCSIIVDAQVCQEIERIDWRCRIRIVFA